jgi:hypothetical protein
LNTLVEALRLRDTARGDRLAPVALDALLFALAEEFAEPARQKGLELRVVRSRVQVMSQATLLAGILRNLMRNAIDYTPPNGRVLVVCRRRGTAVHIEVRDSGAGIPVKELSRLFTAFQRGAATRPADRSGSLGLGLYIVKKTAEHLGHRVELYSAPARGSRFVVIAEAAGGQSARCYVWPTEAG